MKILIIANGIPSPSNQMLGLFEFDQAKALRAEGHEVTFFSVDLRSIRRKRKLGFSSGIKNDIDWYCISLPLGAIPVKWMCRIGAFGLEYLFNRVFSDKKKPDVIHAHFTEIAKMATSVSDKYKIPLVITEHSSAMNQIAINRNLKKIAIDAYDQSSVLITVSSELQRNVKRHTGKESIVVPNIIDTELFNMCKPKKHECFRIVTVSGLIECKRTIILLESFKKAKEVHSDILLDIVGDGPLRSELEKYVIDNKLSDNVVFYGTLPRFRIAEIFENSDCFAMTSRTETFGVVYVEAMAAGLPVIATNCGGPSDFINEKNGIMVEVDNVEQVTNAICYMYDNISKYNDSYIRQFANNRYNPQAIACELISIYSTILNNE